MTLVSADVPPADDDDGAARPTSRRRAPQRKDRLGALNAVPESLAESGPEPLADPSDAVMRDVAGRPVDGPELDVRPLSERRPVPPPARAAVAAPEPVEAHPRSRVGQWPVYDPFSARRRRPPEWLVSYTAWLVVCDLVAAGLALWLTVRVPLFVPPLSAAAVVAAWAAWPVLLAALGTYAERRQGTGADEFRRVAVTGLVAVAGLGVAASTGADAADHLVLVAVPAATALTLGGRLLNRHRLHRARARGLMGQNVVVVGREVAVVDLVRRLRRDTASGLHVIGACVPRPRESSQVVAHGIPVLGGLDEVVRVVDEARADAVLVASASETAGQYLRDLAWRLEGTNIGLLVGPGMIEVAPSRISVRPTLSVPLIRIQEPDFRGYRRVLKTLIDKVMAAVLLVVSAPLMIGIACAVRVSSPGPALYRHRRIGKRGREFDLLKFRSMTDGSDVAIDALMVHNEGNEVQFKLRRDPRVTKVGAILRRYSLDELPQLLNVLKGDMSLVGPRPHVTREVEQYGPDMHRRLLVKPGITGLWQVSGRSDLSWDDAVELDVRYVENWSISLDMLILWRTFRAVVKSSGAY
jgi:exopolysaccharide biosynthesis polyprenyl glycosylphosphotransferase